MQLNNPNPNWTTQFLVDYHFESIQELKVSVYDEDSRGNPDLSKYVHLAAAMRAVFSVCVYR